MVRKVGRRDTLKMFCMTAAGWALSRSTARPSPMLQTVSPTSFLRQERFIPQDAPNILFIMTDDQRQDALSAYGNTILKTPNIDRIATEGMRFTEAFVTNSLCAPSRASFLTGLYSHAHGIITNGASESIFRNQPGLKDNQTTFVHLLKQAGYHTGLVGKWHLRSEPSGFDRWIILPGGGGPYNDPEMITAGMRIKLRGYADDVVADQALMFLQQRPKDRPFCLLYNFKAPHRNWIPATRHEKAFENVDIPVPRTFDTISDTKQAAVRKTEMAIADMPDFSARGVPKTLPREERKRLNYQQLVKNYYRTVLSVDENVGRVLEYLDKNNLAKNTLVIYSSDNGFFLGEHDGLYDKRLMFEPSIRVPLIVRHPERIKPGRVNSSQMVLNIDVAPTLLELAGVPIPNWMHGRSCVPLLEERETPWRDAFLYEFYEYPAEHCARKHRGIRTADWKLIHFWEQPEEWELYDLRNDPDETHNLAGRREQSGRIRELKARLAELRHEVGDVDPPPPPPVSLPCVNGKVPAPTSL